MHNFRELKIWQRSMKLTEDIYHLTVDLPQEEKWGIKSQLRRSAISVPSNIAEGAGRNTNGEFRQFLGITTGSLNELFTQLLLSQKLNLISTENLQPILEEIEEIQKMIYTFSSGLSPMKS